MGRFHAQNYTKQNINKDLDLLDVLNQMKLSGNAIESILHTIAWAWTAYRDIVLKSGEIISKIAKFRGCEYWTENAVRLKFDQDKNGIWEFRQKFNEEGLRHEHIVPKIIFKNTVEDYLDHQPSILVNRLPILKSKMNDNLIGCVVTQLEAKMLDGKDNGLSNKMPIPQETLDFCEIFEPWARYKETAKKAGFSQKIYKLEWDAPTTKNGSWKFISAKEFLSL